MSNAVTPLKGAEYQGFARVTELPAQGMITVRGNQAAMPFPVPGVRQIIHEGDTSCAWMSPDELLVLCPYDAAEETQAQIQDALNGQHHLAVIVSDARAVFSLTGQVKEVLAKLSPADLNGLVSGTIVRTRLAQVPAAFWLMEDQSARVICFRSVAQYVFDLMKTAAHPGSQTGYFD